MNIRRDICGIRGTEMTHNNALQRTVNDKVPVLWPLCPAAERGR
jgi:hypothetical protein